VVVCEVHHAAWTEADAWWETGVPSALSGRDAYDKGKERQVRWL
jgi:3D-(3,5/4)-trihydroxycyclohexane-1,2-dione acylhydrolase (decyclizing)